MATLNRFIGSDAFYILFVLAVLTLGLFGYLLMLVLSLPYIGNEAIPQKQGGLQSDLAKLFFIAILIIIPVVILAFIFIFPASWLTDSLHFFATQAVIASHFDAYTWLALDKYSTRSTFLTSPIFLFYLAGKMSILVTAFICAKLVWNWRKIVTLSKSLPLGSTQSVFAILFFSLLLYFIAFAAQHTGGFFQDFLVKGRRSPVPMAGMIEFVYTAFFFYLLTIPLTKASAKLTNNQNNL